MPKALYSPEAESDLVDSARYIARQNPATASRMIGRIRERANFHADFPDLGQSRSDLSPELRCFVVKRYVIFFRKSPAGIRVIRVLDGSRDIDTIMAPSSGPL